MRKWCWWVSSQWQKTDTYLHKDERQSAGLSDSCEMRRPSSVSLVSTTSSMLFSLSSCVRGLLVCWLWLWLPAGPHWVDPASGGLDHTFHRSQLSDGELHLLSEAGWAHHRPTNAGAHNYCLWDYYAVYSCPYAQQMTVSHSQLALLRPLCEGVSPSDEEVAAANQHAAHPTNRSDSRNDPC